MAENGGGGTSRDPRTGRARVQQLRPTNKDVGAGSGGAAGQLPGISRPTISTSASTSSTPAGAPASGPAQANKATSGPHVVPRIVTGQGSGSTIIVNPRQRGNPLLKHVRNIGWEYGDIVPDYQVGVASCALYLSLKYHRLHPEYIFSRIQNLGNMFSLRILLVQCDVDQHQSALKELTKVALVNNLTIMVAWTLEEAGAYLERYKTYERAAPDLIRERVSDDYMSHLTSALTSIKSVNKTDVITLATHFGSLKRIAQASRDELADCPGFGGKKIQRLQEAFRQPFRVGETRTRRERMAQRSEATSSGARKGPLRPRVAVDAADEDDEARAAAEAMLQTESAIAAQSAVPTDAVATSSSSDDTPALAQGQEAGKGAEEDDASDEIEDADDWGDVLDNMTEEERLQLAMEMSISGGGGEDVNGAAT